MAGRITVLCRLCVGYSLLFGSAAFNMSDVIPDEQVRDIVQLYQKYCPSAPFCRQELRDRQRPLELIENAVPCCEPCVCDAACNITRDCCPDLLEQIVSEEDVRNIQNEHDMHECTSLLYKQSGKEYQNFVMYYNLISICPASFSNTVVTNKCRRRYSDFDFTEDFINFMPVMDVRTKIMYRNKYCLDCHEERIPEHDILPWRVYVYCETDPFPHIDSLIDLKDTLARREECNMAFVIPEGFNKTESFVAERCTAFIDRCNYTGQWLTYDPVLERSCYSYKSIYRGFRNIHCALCNGITESELQAFCNVTTSTDFFNIPFMLELDVHKLTTGHTVNTESSPISTCAPQMFRYGSVCSPFYKAANFFEVEFSFRLVPKQITYVTDRVMSTVMLQTVMSIIHLNNLLTGPPVGLAIAARSNVLVKPDLYNDSNGNIETELVSAKIDYLTIQFNVISFRINDISSLLRQVLTFYQMDLIQERFVQEHYADKERLQKNIAMPYICNKATDDARSKLKFFHYVCSAVNEESVILSENPIFLVNPTPMLLTPITFCPQILLDKHQFTRVLDQDGNITVTVHGKPVRPDQIVFTDHYQSAAVCEDVAYEPKFDEKKNNQTKIDDPDETKINQTKPHDHDNVTINQTKPCDLDVKNNQTKSYDPDDATNHQAKPCDPDDATNNQTKPVSSAKTITATTLSLYALPVTYKYIMGIF